MRWLSFSDTAIAFRRRAAGFYAVLRFQAAVAMIFIAVTAATPRPVVAAAATPKPRFLS